MQFDTEKHLQLKLLISLAFEGCDSKAVNAVSEVVGRTAPSRLVGSTENEKTRQGVCPVAWFLQEVRLR
jgi:hypothetical protein